MLSAKFFWVVLLSSAFILNSCQKPEDEGLDILPQSDLLHAVYSDTTTLTTFTVLDDSLITKGTSVNHLGSYMDPVFGNTNASFFTNFALSTPNVIFGGGYTCDSLVLSLVYRGAFGKLKPQRLRVFQLDSALFSDSIYHSYDMVHFNSISPLATHTFTPNITDSIIIGGDTLPPMLRIPLSVSLGNAFLDPANTTSLSSTSTFQDFFKGIYVVTENGLQGPDQGAILYINLLDSYTKLTLYYSNQSTDPATQKTYDFVINSSCTRFSRFVHDYSTANGNLQGQLNSPNPVSSDYVYAQGLAGVKPKIMLPYLMDYVKKEGKIAINKAELILRADPVYLDDGFENPTALIIVKLDSVGKEYAITDQLEGPTYYGGEYDASKKEYRINIARHVQEIINGNKDYGMFAIVSNRPINANRVVLGGGLPASPYKMKLKLIYTKMN
jgi:hypothetical protein